MELEFAWRSRRWELEVGHTHMRQTDESNIFYPIRLPVAQPTHARKATDR